MVICVLAAGCAVRDVPPAEAEPDQVPADVEPEPVKSADPVEVLEELWADGSLRIRREVIRDAEGGLVNHGIYARWHENGNPEYEVLFVHGKKDGRAVRWHMNGEIWIEEFYVLGLKEGSSRTWNDAGDLVKEEQFAQGKPHGVWTVWKKGRTKARSCFEHGVPVACDPPPAEK
jgi:hypothetical protein